jgi:fatty acid-binding protein DegV
MTMVAIVTDTNASLPLELTRHLGIYQVPQTVIFGEESFEACMQINDVEVFARIDHQGKLPTTAVQREEKHKKVPNTGSLSSNASRISRIK